MRRYGRSAHSGSSCRSISGILLGVALVAGAGDRCRASTIPYWQDESGTIAVTPDARPSAGDEDSLLVSLPGMATNDDSSLYYSLRRTVPGAAVEGGRINEERLATARIISQHSERLYGLDLEILDTESSLPGAPVYSRTVKIPLRSDLFLLDLSSTPHKTNDLDAVMKEVVRNLANANSPAPRHATESLMTAVVYTLMAALILLVTAARR